MTTSPNNHPPLPIRQMTGAICILLCAIAIFGFSGMAAAQGWGRLPFGRTGSSAADTIQFSFYGGGRNADTVQVAPYDSAVVAGCTLNACSTSSEIFLYCNRDRIRQFGDLYWFKLCVNNTASITRAEVLTWKRTSENGFSVIDRSGDISAALAAGGDGNCTKVIFSRPLRRAIVGSWISIRIAKTGTAPCLYSHAVWAGGDSTYYKADSAATTTAYAWKVNGQARGYTIAFEVGGQSPFVTTLGNSIGAGHPYWRSLIEIIGYHNLDDSAYYSWQYHFAKAAKAPFGGVEPTYQSFDIGAQTSTDMLARIQYMLAAKALVVYNEFGLNDVQQAVSYSTFASNVETILAKEIRNGSAAVFVVGWPWSKGRATAMDSLARYWAIIDSVVGDRGLVIDLAPILGKERPGGPPGNRWDIKPEFAYTDSIHYKAAGDSVIGYYLASQLYRIIEPPIDSLVVTIGGTDSAKFADAFFHGYYTGRNEGGAVTSDATYGVGMRDVSGTPYRVASAFGWQQPRFLGPDTLRACSLYVYNIGGAGTSVTIGVHVALRNAVEGISNDATVVSSVSHANRGYVTGNPQGLTRTMCLSCTSAVDLAWGVADNAWTHAGGDYATARLSSVTLNATQITTPGFIAIDILAAAKLMRPFDGKFIILEDSTASNNNYVRLAPRESSTPGRRPQVKYWLQVAGDSTALISRAP